MNNQITKTITSPLLALCASALLVFSAAVSAGQTASLTFVRTIDTDDLFSEDFFSAGNPNLAGVGFPPGAHTLLVLDQPSGGATFVVASPPKHKNGKVAQASIAVADPVNIAFDSVSVGAKGFGLFRLFLWDPDTGKLIAIKADARNVMDAAKIKHFDVPPFGVANAQGMTMNPATGQLFVLDGDVARVVGIQPKPGREFAGATVASMMLPGGLGELRGLAFNPANNHLYVVSARVQKLYELTLEGELVASLDIAGATMGPPQAVVFAPSLDLTDHPSIFHLYAVTGQGLNGEVTEWALPGPF